MCLVVVVAVLDVEGGRAEIGLVDVEPGRREGVARAIKWLRLGRSSSLSESQQL